MSIVEQRSITIDNKIITRADLEKLGKVLYLFYRRKKERNIEDSSRSLSFSVVCQGSIQYSSPDPKIFSDDSPINSNRVIAVEMNYEFPGEKIKIMIEHNAEYGRSNYVIVQGDNSNWVHGTLKKFEDIIELFEHQRGFDRGQRVLWTCIFTISIGLFIINYLDSYLFTVDGAGFLPTTVQYAFSFTLGLVPAALLLHWMQQIWPRVELQIGPPHKMTEKNRRESIAKVITVTGLLSFVVQIAIEG